MFLVVGYWNNTKYLVAILKSQKLPVLHFTAYGGQINVGCGCGEFEVKQTRSVFMHFKMMDLDVFWRH